MTQLAELLQLSQQSNLEPVDRWKNVHSDILQQHRGQQQQVPRWLHPVRQGH